MLERHISSLSPLKTTMNHQQIIVFPGEFVDVVMLSPSNHGSSV
ncbi:hypothetical protein C1A50_0022 [Paenibacillus polymyxa]|nr:hypothetical protein C1A50_0022 [Paenibacillus polymyxa]